MGRHLTEERFQFFDVVVCNLDAVVLTHHPEDPRCKGTERGIGTAERQCLGIEDQFGEELTQNSRIGKEPLEKRLQRCEVKQGFVHIENDNGWAFELGHRGTVLCGVYDQPRLRRHPTNHEPSERFEGNPPYAPAPRHASSDPRQSTD